MRITPTKDGYRIEGSSGEAVNMRMEEAVELVPLARQIQDHIRSRFPQTVPVYTYAVEAVILGLDAHRTQALLRFVGPDGLETSYAVSLSTAKLLRDGLTTKIEQIERGQKGRTTQ
jgi:hypothetical protein